MAKIDFVSMGDITTDAFIDLYEKDVRITEGTHGRPTQMSINFGDKIEYNSVEIIPAVGNSPNASVSAHRLGLNSALVTNIGDDQNGEDCMAQLRQEGIKTDYVVKNEGKFTNYHYVLRVRAERTILIKHEEYDYVMPTFDESPSWMYLSSFGENSLPFHDEIANYIEKNDTKLSFQPGTFQIKIGFEKLKKIYENSELFFCNKEEAQRILSSTTNDIISLLKGVHELGPKIVVITDGPEGAYAYDGKQGWSHPMYPDPAPPVDRTGAGDAFSSTFTSAIALGKTIPEALSWGPINSMSVVQHIGAQRGLLAREKLEEYLANAPEDYKPTEII
ncbi:hypothetical protein COW81_02805 [Candidatus Campbellbacteria bacterium CG22_combo_CG10-13_8_21_14_all_36_13]|uniref:Carbohydrate kinase PfkB domain-containing protein n=1 Tax=Candidatus Campbellbacteria bacterium CG22_combo_CG10-13_8_21_14_all_36_13 TaxID=1974529 RepID=A0A2H0DYA9_9BACT|nr:MAG: hypothetical protein COW81_02805 [Candidatus Campbellbacteria bacterium CG22_combo_CG10-13_8_21_14_all_36_13]